MDGDPRTSGSGSCGLFRQVEDYFSDDCHRGPDSGDRKLSRLAAHDRLRDDLHRRAAEPPFSAVLLQGCASLPDALAV